jgi:hypothetical protein
VLRITLAICLLFTASSGHAGMILDGVPDSQYTNYATLFPSVGKLGIGGGTLIAPQWVMTAAHIPNNQIGSFEIGGNSYGVAEIIRHPQFVLNGNDLGFGYDIALVRLSSPVVGINPATLYTGTSELGATLSMAGYGRTGVGSSNDPQNPGTFRAGTNVADVIASFSNGSSGQLGAENAVLVTDFDAPPAFNPNGNLNTLGAPTATSLEYQLAGGDSGGGAFIQENGQWYVAGIHSAVTSQQGWAGSGSNQSFGYGAVSLMTRVSRYEAFIGSVTGVPEPNSLLLVVTCLAASLGSFFRPRSEKSS